MSAKTSTGYMPMMTCPSCGKSWQWDDYYCVEVDSERECPFCGNTAIVSEKEVLMYVTLTVKVKP